MSCTFQLNNEFTYRLIPCLSGRDHSNFQALVGQTNIMSTATLINIVRVVQHPNYNSRTMVNDICVCRLASTLIFSTKIQAVVLPSATLTVPDGTLLFVSGWGNLFVPTQQTPQFPENLQGVSIPAWSTARCQQAYGRSIKIVSQQHICAGEIGRDSCQGDSGGAVMHNGVQVGIVSFGNSCAERWPGVNSRVSNFLTFIKREMNRA